MGDVSLEPEEVYKGSVAIGNDGASVRLSTDMPKTAFKLRPNSADELTASEVCQRSGVQGVWPSCLPTDDEDHLQEATKAAGDYLKANGILKFIRELFQTVRKEKPPDHFGFIAEKFRDRAVTEIAEVGEIPAIGSNQVQADNVPRS